MPDRLSQPEIGQRIVVVGTTGSGKTTLACRIAALRQVPHIELDALHWQANWTEAPLDVFRARIAQAVAGEMWALDGNSSRTRDIVWQRADTIIWIDYSLAVILSRLVRRTLRRVLAREELWNGNRETWRGTVFSRDSVLWWALKTYRRRRREYPELFARPEYQHLTVIRLRSPQGGTMAGANLRLTAGVRALRAAPWAECVRESGPLCYNGALCRVNSQPFSAACYWAR